LEDKRVRKEEGMKFPLLFTREGLSMSGADGKEKYLHHRPREGGRRSSLFNVGQKLAKVKNHHHIKKFEGVSPRKLIRGREKSG